MSVTYGFYNSKNRDRRYDAIQMSSIFDGIIRDGVLQHFGTNGYPSAGAWYDSTVELPNEIMMYGSLVFTPAGDGSFVPNRYTIDKTQLALMKMYPRFINPGRYWYWLRDVVSSAYFADVGSDGSAGSNGASASGGVRPVFGLVG